MKNKKSFFKFELFSIIFIIVLGIILHFSYEWSNNNLFVGSFSAVNESVWEHLKLIFFPTLIAIIISYFYLKDIFPQYLFAKTKGLLYALAFTVIFFYTYSGILGYTITFFDIGSFFVAIIIEEFITIKTLIYNPLNINTKPTIITLIILLFSFIIFTYLTPKLGIFKDPITNTYGIFKLK